MRRLNVVAGWEARGGAAPDRRVDERLLPLLRAIARDGTLKAAARSCGVPYRTAWGVLEDAGRDIAPVVALEPGRGASLTAFAQRWLALDEAARGTLAQAGLALDVRRSPGGDADTMPLRVAASHDIALAQLKDRWRLAHAIALEFHGSAASLAAYAAGDAEAAGFHVAAGAAAAADPLLARIDVKRDAVMRFMTREQGLIVPRGNPQALRGVADLAGMRVTIVNRQPGSGTRILFDRLLDEAGIAAEDIGGYSNEEFTHAAVAATVAAGRADAAFGIRAAAAQFGLGFVPLATERYLFVCRRRTLASTRIDAFRRLLASAATRAVVRPLPGYRLDAPGRLLSPRGR